MFDPNLDPDVESAARRVLDAAYELETVSRRVQATDIAEMWGERTTVTNRLMDDLAAMETSSPELKAYAERVRSGECEWSQIEQLARPVPPEVAELQHSPSFDWQWRPAPAKPSDQLVDDDAYYQRKSWLV